MSEPLNTRSLSSSSAGGWRCPSLSQTSTSSGEPRESMGREFYVEKYSLSPRVATDSPNSLDDSRKTSTSDIAGAPSSAWQHRLPLSGPTHPYSHSISSSTSARTTNAVPTATPDNDYLGFCKSAWKLQTGDRKGAMEKCKEPLAWSMYNASAMPQYLKCRHSKCSFRSSFVSPNANTIYNKVISHPAKGLKLRWRFLAKSHVPQKFTLGNRYAFKCLFCVYGARSGCAGVYVGEEYYLDHIAAEHSSQILGDVLLYKTGCINDRIAEDREDYDINIWPRASSEPQHPQQWLADSLLGDPAIRTNTSVTDVGFRANEPWIWKSRDEAPDRAFTLEPLTADSVVANGDPVQAHRLQDTATRRQAVNYHYEPWEDNPEEIWGEKAESIMMEQVAAPRPPVPARSKARGTARPSGEMPGIQSASGVEDSLAPTHALLSRVVPDQQFGESDSERCVISVGTHATTNEGMLDKAPPTNALPQALLHNLVQVYIDANQVIEQLRLQPAAVDPATLQPLEQSIREAPDEIDKERQRGISRLGESFELGDYTSILVLQQLTIQLRSNLVDRLLRATSGTAKIDAAALADVADSIRHRTVTTLHELRQRLAQSATLSNRSAYSTHKMSHQDSQHSSGAPAEISHLRTNSWQAPEVQSPLTATKQPAHRTQQSAPVVENKRRGSVLGFIKKSTTKASSARIAGSQQDVAGLAEKTRLELGLHKQKRQLSVGQIPGIAELDAAPAST